MSDPTQLSAMPDRLAIELAMIGYVVRAIEWTDEHEYGTDTTTPRILCIHLDNGATVEFGSGGELDDVHAYAALTQPPASPIRVPEAQQLADENTAARANLHAASASEIVFNDERRHADRFVLTVGYGDRMALYIEATVTPKPTPAGAAVRNMAALPSIRDAQDNELGHVSYLRIVKGWGRSRLVVFNLATNRDFLDTALLPSARPVFLPNLVELLRTRRLIQSLAD